MFQKTNKKFNKARHTHCTIDFLKWIYISMNYTNYKIQSSGANALQNMRKGSDLDGNLSVL